MWLILCKSFKLQRCGSFYVKALSHKVWLILHKLLRVYIKPVYIYVIMFFSMASNLTLPTKGLATYTIHTATCPSVYCPFPTKKSRIMSSMSRNKSCKMSNNISSNMQQHTLQHDLQHVLQYGLQHVLQIMQYIQKHVHQYIQ